MGTVYISRSQARRVLSRLENFKADEVFRVFKIAHPEVKIIPKNMNKAVAFMVGRVGEV